MYDNIYIYVTINITITITITIVILIYIYFCIISNIVIDIRTHIFIHVVEYNYIF